MSKVTPQLRGKGLEDAGFTFGLWLLGNASSPFLGGLAKAFDEVEKGKKGGLVTKWLRR